MTFPVIVFAAAAATASLPTFAGIQLGAPPSMPECERNQFTFEPEPGEATSYKTVQSRQCIELPDPGRDGALIYFPPDTMPSIASFNWLGYQMIDGRIVGVSIATMDHNYADVIVGRLVEKFGKPTDDTPTEVVLDHISVPARTVRWVRQGYSVTYESMIDIDRGVVLVETDAGHAARLKAELRPLKSATPL